LLKKSLTSLATLGIIFHPASALPSILIVIGAFLNSLLKTTDLLP